MCDKRAAQRRPRAAGCKDADVTGLRVDHVTVAQPVAASIVIAPHPPDEIGVDHIVRVKRKEIAVPLHMVGQGMAEVFDLGFLVEAFHCLFEGQKPDTVVEVDALGAVLRTNEQSPVRVCLRAQRSHGAGDGSADRAPVVGEGA